MSSTVNGFLDWVTANPESIGIVVFFIAFAESMVIIGLFAPGVVTMLAASSLIAAGKVEFLPLYLLAVAGAILGDAVSFWLGHHYQDSIRNLGPLKSRQAMMERGDRFFKRWGWMSVVIGRFFGPVRAVIPLIAGMMKMPVGVFMFANVASALVWGAVYLVPGWLYDTFPDF